MCIVLGGPNQAPTTGITQIDLIFLDNSAVVRVRRVMDYSLGGKHELIKIRVNERKNSLTSIGTCRGNGRKRQPLKQIQFPK